MPPSDAAGQVLREAFPDHALLGEEGGVSGNTASEYLWCIDPLDGTTNFSHSYPSFATSVAGGAALRSLSCCKPLSCPAHASCPPIACRAAQGFALGSEPPALNP